MEHGRVRNSSWGYEVMVGLEMLRHLLSSPSPTSVRPERVRVHCTRAVLSALPDVFDECLRCDVDRCPVRGCKAILARRFHGEGTMFTSMKETAQLRRPALFAELQAGMTLGTLSTRDMGALCTRVHHLARTNLTFIRPSWVQLVYLVHGHARAHVSSTNQVHELAGDGLLHAEFLRFERYRTRQKFASPWVRNSRSIHQPTFLYLPGGHRFKTILTMLALIWVIDRFRRPCSIAAPGRRHTGVRFEKLKSHGRCPCAVD